MIVKRPTLVPTLRLIALAALILATAPGVSARPVDPDWKLQATSTDFQVNTYTTDIQSSSAVAAQGDGFVVVWESFGSPDTDSDGQSVQARFFDSAGLAVGDQFQVNTYTTQGQTKPRVASWADGRFVVIWREYSSGATGRLFDSAGQAVSEFDVLPGQGLYSGGDVAVSDERMLVVWSMAVDGSSFGIGGSLFDSAGAVIGSDFFINSYTTNLQADPRVAATTDGGFVVVWGSRFAGPSDDYGIVMRRLDSAGTPLAADMQVNSLTADRQTKPAVTAGSDGGFVVSWNSYLFGVDEDALVARRFDSAGSALGEDFQVEQALEGYQRLGSLASTPDGGFVAAWHGDFDGSVSTDIGASRLDASGLRAEDDFVVNSLQPGLQTQPNSASNARGDVFMSWTSTRSDGDDADRSIQARLFLAQADVGVSKSNGADVVSAGGRTTYTIVAFNDGPDAATGVRLIDELPGDLTCTWTSAADAGVSGQTASGAGNLDETLMLPPNASVTYTLDCDIAMDAAGTLMNVATISAEQLDENVANDSASDLDEVTDLFADGFESGDTTAWSEEVP